MSHELSTTSSTLKPVKITDDMNMAMGRLVRASSELEDIVTLFLCRMANIDEGRAIVLLGHSAVSAKLRIARVFAKARGAETAALFDQCFENEAFRKIIWCRNIVAHGILLGQTERGLIAFRTNGAMEANTSTVSVEVISLEFDAFSKAADAAEAAVIQLEVKLQVRSLREKRRKQVLDPHTKAQASRTPSAKPQRQLKPSRK